MVNVGSTSSGARVLEVKGDKAKFQFTQPIVAQPDEKIAISRKISQNYRLIGWGTILCGFKTNLVFKQDFK